MSAPRRCDEFAAGLTCARYGRVVMTRSQRTEAELKAAARRLLTRKPYADIKITDITSEAGRAAGSFYRHFTDKEALMSALIDDFATKVHEQVVGRMGQDHTLSTRADVRAHVEAYWRGYREHLPEMSGLFQVAMLSERFRAIHDDLREWQVRAWAGHLEDLKYPGPARLTALSIICLLESFAFDLIGRVDQRVNGSASGGSAGGMEASVDTDAIEALTGLLTAGLLGAAPPD